ncbi:DNA adenine methylase (plasmid) [Vibrio alginolyticus]|nr:DNA adenine methylase [Vibrio alginolyticus]
MRYLGAKGASGAYQAIIANMPQHSIYIEAFLGTGVIFNKKPPVAHSIGVELDSVTMSQFEPCHPVELYTMCFFDFLKLFAFGETEQTFIYADPPYLQETRTSENRYREEFTREQHVALLTHFNALTAQGVKIMLSGYPSALYDELLPDWRTFEFNVMSRGGVRTEKLWMNYSKESSHWITYAGKNYSDRQRIKRKAERWANKFEKLDTNERRAILAAILDVM